MIPHKDVLWTVPVLQTNQTPPQQPTTTIQRKYLVSVIHCYLRQKSYPANFAKVDKHALA